MRIASYSPSASAWLKLIEPGIASSPAGIADSTGIAADSTLTLVQFEANDGATVSTRGDVFDLLILPPDVQYDPTATDSAPTESAVLVWAPHSLKSALDHALRLARKVHRLPRFMQVLAEKEMSLRRLHGLIQTGAAGNEKVGVSAVCMEFDGTWRIFGKWAPDLIERAGGQPLLVDSGDPAITALAADLAKARPDFMFVAYAAGDLSPRETKASRDGDAPHGSEDARENEASRVSKASRAYEAYEAAPGAVDMKKRLSDLLREASIEPEVYLLPAALLLSSGPALYATVFRMAAAFHPECKQLSEYRRTLVQLETESD